MNFQLPEPSPRPSIHPYGRGQFILVASPSPPYWEGKGEAGAQARYGWTRGRGLGAAPRHVWCRVVGPLAPAFWGEIVPRTLQAPPRIVPPPTCGLLIPAANRRPGSYGRRAGGRAGGAIRPATARMLVGDGSTRKDAVNKKRKYF